MGGFADRGFTRLALDFVKALAASLRETDKVRPCVEHYKLFAQYSDVNSSVKAFPGRCMVPIPASEWQLY